MKLHHLPSLGKKPSKRLGRGYGSGVGGHYSTRGGKGHTARQGKPIPLWFEGGQLPLVKRLPWLRGKGRLKSLTPYQEVQLKAVVAKGLTDVNPETLKAAGFIRDTRLQIRLIGAQELKTALTVTGVVATGPVVAAIEKAGGSVNA